MPAEAINSDNVHVHQWQQSALQLRNTDANPDSIMPDTPIPHLCSNLRKLSRQPVAPHGAHKGGGVPPADGAHVGSRGLWGAAPGGGGGPLAATTWGGGVLLGRLARGKGRWGRGWGVQRRAPGGGRGWEGGDGDKYQPECLLVGDAFKNSKCSRAL